MNFVGIRLGMDSSEGELGRFRANCGNRKPALANTAGDGIKYGSRGMVGGEDSKPHAYSLLKLDGTERKLKTKEISS